MGAANTHFEETGADGIPIAASVCRRVPCWAPLSTDPAVVNCAWCRRWLAKQRGKEHPDTERVTVRNVRAGRSVYRVDRGRRLVGRVALLTTRRWSATDPAAHVLGEHFARRQDAVDALLRHDDDRQAESEEDRP